jgi:phenylalanine-4-hydroxylase
VDAVEVLPQHLQKYIVSQHYERYTPVDQAVWRYVLRQLKRFLSEHADDAYVEGLDKTGIEIEQIPRIENISKKLEKFGWRALPVSGFIPPAAFMELQSLGVLPIASDMRSIDHLLYTPAPDIVHEAAGHAPILANEEYANYLKQYAQVAKKAILSKEDLDQYEAIRELSDVKENPSSTAEQITQAENRLRDVTAKISFVSEGAELSRMNWWTAEYGLIKKNQKIKIFGAGLLSSIGESKWCLTDVVRKIPLSIDCVKQSYDITEPQPQLYVAESFSQLSDVLELFSRTMAYRQGGIPALKKLIQAETVNTVEFENGLQISGILKSYKTDSEQAVSYVQFSGPTQLCFHDKQVSDHGRDYHKEGYGTPVGAIENLGDLKLNQTVTLNYSSGIRITGQLEKILALSDSAKILTFSNATCTDGEDTLFKPEWGFYDVLLVNRVISGFGGPADRIAYGEVEDFVASRVSAPHYSEERLKIFKLYQQVRQLRQDQNATEEQFKELFLKIGQQANQEWLLFVEMVEISNLKKFNPDFTKLILFHLEKLKSENPLMKPLIDEGLSLAQEISYETH